LIMVKSMKSVYDKEWTDFKLGLLAEVKSGRDIYAQDRIDGETPYVTAGTANNGIGYFVGNDNDSKDRNIISVNRNGAVGEAFYHPYTALFGNDCRRVSMRSTSDSNAQLFIAESISHQKSAFSYSRKLGTARLNNLHFMLPVSSVGEPDYEYMAKYSIEKQKELIEKYKKLLEKQIQEIDYRNIPHLEEKDWIPISVYSIFHLIRGRENNMAILDDGKMPLISAKKINNGLKGFVSSPNRTVKGNCISLNNDGDGGAGLAYYQPYEMALDTHVTALIPKENISKWSMLFISECISKLHGFFGHGLSISNKRAKNIQIMLPVTDDGQPDYEYMEQYAKNMMLKKYNQYLSYLEHKKEKK